MLLQADGMAKGLPTNTAAERSGSAVGTPDVDLQPVRGGEHLEQKPPFHDRVDSTVESNQLDVSKMFNLTSSEYNLLIRVFWALKLIKYVAIWFFGCHWEHLELCLVVKI